MVGTRIWSINMRSPSPECYTTCWMMTINSDTLYWSGITPILTLLLSWTLLLNLIFYLIARGFHKHLQRVRHANRGRLLLWTPGPVPLWDLPKLYDVPVGFEPPPILRLNIAYFAVAEGWLLLDIGWFVLLLQVFSCWSLLNLSCFRTFEFRVSNSVLLLFAW